VTLGFNNLRPVKQRVTFGADSITVNGTKLASVRITVLVIHVFYPTAIAKAGVLTEHKTIKHKDGIYAIGDVYTNTVESAFSLLKRGIVGTWHKISAKHLQAYLDEMCWRFDNRKNPYLFRDTIKRMLNAENLEFKELIAA
jgi:hypothetical protein